MHCYRHPHPAVTADVVLLADGALTPVVLLIRRGGEPFKAKSALPGGFVEIDIEDARQRFGRPPTGRPPTSATRS